MGVSILPFDHGVDLSFIGNIRLYHQPLRWSLGFESLLGLVGTGLIDIRYHNTSGARFPQDLGHSAADPRSRTRDNGHFSGPPLAHTVGASSGEMIRHWRCSPCSPASAETNFWLKALHATLRGPECIHRRRHVGCRVDHRHSQDHRSNPKFTPAIADAEFPELVGRIVLIKGCDVYGQGFEAGEWGCGV